MIELENKNIGSIGMSIESKLIKLCGISQFQIKLFNNSHTEIFFLDDDGRLWHADLNEYWNDQEKTIEAKQIKFKGV